MKIYTRTGDAGDTALFGGGRVPKDDARVEAYGGVDETNSAIGLAIVALDRETLADVAAWLRATQEDLFAIGAHLATPGAVGGGRAAEHLPPLPLAQIARIESWIDTADTRLEPLRNFILPGGTEAAARLQVARTVCRRAERRVVSLSGASPVDPGIIVYLNRLSDLLFTCARLANHAAGVEDIYWTGRH